jgi:hypothetical protein
MKKYNITIKAHAISKINESKIVSQERLDHEMKENKVSTIPHLERKLEDEMLKQKDNSFECTFAEVSIKEIQE